VALSAAGEYRVVVEFGPGGRFDGGSIQVSGPMLHDIDLHGGSLAGRVLDESTGAPVGGATVQLNRFGGGYGPLSAMTDPEGRFAIDPVSGGKYNLRVWKQRYAMSVTDVEIREDVPRDVEIRLRPGERVAVRVVDRENGRLIEEVSLTVQDAAAKRVVQSGPALREDDGSWRLWAPPGQYTLRVWAMGYAPASAGITVPGPEVTVAMMRGGRVVLQGIPPGAMRARLRNAQQRIEATVGAPPGVFENIAPGTYQVEVIGDDGKVMVARPVTVEAGQTSVVPLG
jgi:5-hydroxyisourate hydrolase-like protein (transthyretin family)